MGAVSRENKVVDFTECKIVYIAIDEPMVLMPYGCSSNEMHITKDPVRFLKKA